MALSKPKDLFHYELSAMYDAEKKIAEMLKEVAGQVEDKKLAEMLRAHEKETRQQISNLERGFEMLGTEPRDVSCAGIEGIQAEYQEISGMKPSSEVLSMAALGGAMKIEHYEIATYRGLLDKAMLMGENEFAQLLQTNLVQEEETAGKLERASHDMSQQVLAAA